MPYRVCIDAAPSFEAFNHLISQTIIHGHTVHVGSQRDVDHETGRKVAGGVEAKIPKCWRTSSQSARPPRCCATLS